MVLDPVVQKVNLKSPKAVSEWRKKFRVALVNKRKFLCDFCQKEITTQTGFDLHEAILSRADVVGCNWAGAIYSEWNCLVLHPNPCHQPSPPSREWAWDYLTGLYGSDIIDNWYLSLPYKTGKPPRIF